MGGGGVGIRPAPFDCSSLTPLVRSQRRQEALFEASNINGVIECIDFIITFPSI